MELKDVFGRRKCCLSAGTGMSCNKFQPRIINVPLKKGSGPAEFRRGMRRSILPQLQAQSALLKVIKIKLRLQ